MSRRKQSHPKPLKLSSDEPSIKTDGVEHPDVKKEEDSVDENGLGGCNQGESNDGDATSSSDKSPKESNATEKKEECVRDESASDAENTVGTESVKIKQEVNRDSESPTMLQGWANQLHLPKDVLYLKRMEITMHGNTAVCWVVCCGIPLPKGSSLGPFQGEITSSEKVRMGDLILPFSGKNCSVLVNVTAKSGAWLAFVRVAGNDTVNMCVHFEGDRLWCEVVSDIEEGSELIGSFVYHQENESPSRPESPAQPTPPAVEEEPVVKQEPVPSTSSSSSKRSPTNHAALIYVCPFCGVRFSSPRTLQGHIMYYCSKKPPDPAVKTEDETQAENKNPTNSEDNEEPKPMDTSESTNSNENAAGPVKRTLEVNNQMESDAPSAKSVKTGQLFKCPHCSYTADKLSSLNRHRRIHNRPSEDRDDIVIGPVALSETYCKDCNIQFSTFSTFRGHKEFYCNKRGSQTSEDEAPREEKAEESSSSQGSPNSQQGDPTRNIFLPGGSLMTQAMFPSVSSGTVIPGQTAVIFAPPVMAPSEMGITVPTVILQPVIANPASSVVGESKNSPIPPLSMVPSQAHQKSTITKPTTSCSEKPLDLSTKKETCPDKENSPEKILNLAKNSLKLITSQSILKEMPPLVKTESRSPPLVSPRSVASNSSSYESSRSPQPKQSRSPQHGRRSPQQSSTNRSVSRSPEHSQRSSLHNSSMPFLPLAIPGMSVPPLQTPIATVSKCADCNIVFYKHENYLIHKEHYCSGRKTKYSSPPKPESLKSPKGSPDAPSPAKSEASSPSLKESSESKNDSSEDLYYRFFCVPCKIKFSSASTLKAHKEFYCPHGKDSGHSVVIQANNDSQEPPKAPSTPEALDFRCDLCNSAFTTSRLLKLHLCSGDSTSMPLFRCPHCSYVTQTDTRLADHMKVHAPTRAFRCTVCGYRGNTVRGMRMHGKMHIDNGEEFTDASMIEYEEPAQTPIQTNGQTPHGPVDMEAELIRLKNEPYKRRRSRKSFEKPEYMVCPVPCPQTHQCPVCRDSFPSLKFLSVHMRIHEVALKYQHEGIPCDFCSYTAHSKEDLRFHMNSLHKTPQSSPSPNSRKDSPLSQSTAIDNKEQSVHIKVEPVDYEVENMKNSDRDGYERSTAQSDRDRCDNYRTKDNSSSHSYSDSDKLDLFRHSRKDFHKLSDREMYDDTESRDGERGGSKRDTPDTGKYSDRDKGIDETDHHEIHKQSEKDKFSSAKISEQVKKEVFTSSPDKENVKTENLLDRSNTPKSDSSQNVRSPPFSRTSPQSCLSPNKSSSPPEKSGSQLSPGSVTHCSRSPDSARTTMSNGAPSHSIVFPNGPMFPYLLIPPQSARDEASPDTTSPKIERGPKYCKNCDISFTYLATFLAHKKYYCTASKATEELSPLASA